MSPIATVICAMQSPRWATAVLFLSRVRRAEVVSMVRFSRRSRGLHTVAIMTVVGLCGRARSPIPRVCQYSAGSRGARVRDRAACGYAQVALGGLRAHRTGHRRRAAPSPRSVPAQCARPRRSPSRVSQLQPNYAGTLSQWGVMDGEPIGGARMCARSSIAGPSRRPCPYVHADAREAAPLCGRGSGEALEGKGNYRRCIRWRRARTSPGHAGEGAATLMGEMERRLDSATDFRMGRPTRPGG